MSRKKKSIDLHPIFTNCVWRIDNSLSLEEKKKKCKECYSSLKEKTEYCNHVIEHIVNK